MGRPLSDDELAAALKRRSQPKALSDDELAQRLMQRDATTAAVIHDADTFRSPDSPFDVRSHGIDAPETAHGPGDVDQPGGREALEARQKRLQGKKITFGGATRDRHGRDVASIYVDGKSEQVEQVRNGEAEVYREYLGEVSPRLRNELLKAEEEAKSAKRGIWGVEGYEKPQDWRRRQDIQKYQKTGKGPNPLGTQPQDKDEAEDGALNRVLDSLDYANNISRSAIHGAVSAPSGHRLDAAIQAFKDAAAKKKKISASDLRDAVNKRLGHGKVRFGRDNDGKTTVGDALDVVTDMVIDVGTDPLTYLTGGLSALAKAGKLAKGAKAGKAGLGLQLGKAGVGGTLGFGATNENDSLAQKAIMTAAGAAAPKLVGKGVEKLAPKLREGFDHAYDKYARLTGRTADAPLEIETIWRKKKSGELGKEALDQADAQIPRVKTTAEQADRTIKVRELAQEIEARELAKVEGFVRTKALDQVAIKRGFKPDDLDSVAKHADEIEDTARTIFETKLTPMAIPAALRLQKAGLDKIKQISHVIMQGRYRALDGLDDVEKQTASDVMHAGKEYFKEVREDLFKTHQFDPAKHTGNGLMERIQRSELDDDELQHVVRKLNDDHYKARDRKLGELEAKGASAQALTSYMNKMETTHLNSLRDLQQGHVPLQQQKKVYGILQDKGQKTFNELTEVATRRTEEGWEKAALAKQTEKVRRAVEDWTRHNEEITRKFNDEVLNVPGGKAKDGKGIIGVKWHIDDVYMPSALDEAEEILQVAKRGNVQAARAKGASDAGERLGLDKSYSIYARGMAYKFLDEQTKEAMRIARGYQALVANNGLARNWEKLLSGFDTLSNFAKANMLYFSMSWLKNNYFDNLAKAWIEGGFDNLVDAAKLGGFRSDLQKDLWNLAGGKFNFAGKTEGLDEAFELGVLDGPAFDALVDKEGISSLVRQDPLYKHYFKVKDAEKPGLIKRLADAWVEKLAGTVGRVGNVVEGSARFTTFQNTKKMLLSLDEFKGQPRQAAEMAAELTRKTFFDYGDITAMENAVFKRLIPFYSFYSKNLPYWAGAVIDPQRVGRVAAFQSVRDNIGEEATAHDEKTLTPHIKTNNPRKVGRDEMGNDLYVISPASSLDDAVKMVGGSIEAIKEKKIPDWVVEKGSPHLKAIAEIATKKDLFSDNELLPSESVKGKKYLYSRGFRLVAVQKAAEALGLPEKALGIHVDARGNPYATKDSTILVDKVFSTLWPQSFIDQIAGSTGKLAHDKETVMEMLLNRLSPAQVVKVSPEMRRMRKTNKERAE